MKSQLNPFSYEARLIQRMRDAEASLWFLAQGYGIMFDALQRETMVIKRQITSRRRAIEAMVHASRNK